MALYRPACFLRLQIRLEDFSATIDPNVPSEDSPFAAKFKVVQQQITDLQGQLARAKSHPEAADHATAADLAKRLKQAQRSLKQISSQVAKARPQMEQPGDLFSIDLVTVPVDMSVELNSFRMSDTLSATFPFIDAPLVSDLIRSALVEVYLGTIAADKFAQPSSWQLPLERAQITFRGYVDTWDTSHDEGDAVVSISARSLEAILIDAKINPLAKAYRIDGRGEPISAYVNRILGQLPATGGKTGGDQLKALWFNAAPDSEPILDKKLFMRSLQTAKSQNQATNNQPTPQPAGGTPPGQVPGEGEVRMPVQAPGLEMSTWDLITQACQIAGCLPVYDPSLTPPPPLGPGDVILLRPPQTIYEDVYSGTTIPGGAADGFQRDFKDPRSGAILHSDLRLMVWGKNVSSIKTSRKLGRVTAPAVEVVSYNPDAPAGERRVVVRYPNVHVASTIGHKGQGKIDRVVTRSIKGIRDPVQLKQIAVGLHQSLSRQERSVKITTSDLASYIDPITGLDPNEVHDLFKLRSGASVRVMVAQQVQDPSQGLVIVPLSNVFEKRPSEIQRLLQTQNGRFRSNLTLDQQAKLAELMTGRIAQALDKAKLTDLFYVRTIIWKWNADSGVDAEMELVNFLEARGVPHSAADKAANDKFKKATSPKPTAAATAANRAQRSQGKF